MAHYATKIITSKKEWEGFVLKQNPRSFLHSWNWGETQKTTGNSIVRMGFYENKKLIGCALLIHQSAKRGPHFLIPGGPFIDWNNKNQVRYAFSEIKNYARKEKAWFVRIRPELEDSPEGRKMMKHLGLTKAPMHLHAENTWVLRVDKPDEELLSGMRKSTRYLVRKALTEKNLKVITTKDPQKLSVLVELQEETARRHNFVKFSSKLFKAQMDTFAKDDQADLFICYKGKTPLVAAIIIYYGKWAYYHHSGSSSNHPEVPSSYLTQWKIIQTARERGLEYYNFWGIAATDNPQHRFAGVTLFKKGFGGERIDWVPAHDMPLSPLYWTTHIFETARKKMRKL